MRFAASIATLFTELPFLDRFSAAREAGFSGIECWYLDDYPLAEVKAALKDCGLPLVVFNMPRSGKAGQESVGPTFQPRRLLTCLLKNGISAVPVCWIGWQAAR